MAVYLAYPGVQDMFLTDEPVFTHFKTVYFRDSASASKVVEQPFDAISYRPGDTLISTIRQNGDFITDWSLKIILPKTTTDSPYWIFKDYLNLVGKKMRVFNSGGQELYDVQLNGLTATTINTNWYNIQNSTLAQDKQYNLSIKQVSCGGFHSMFVTNDGALYGMGNNGFGQLGDGTYDDKNVPTLIVPSNVSSVSCGYYHTMYVTTSGSLYGIGYNEFGQLGDGTNVNRSVPTLIVNSGVSSVSCGGFHSMYVTTSGGALYGTGENNFGQLGDGTTVNRYVPTLVVTSGVSSVVASFYNSMYVTTSGALYGVGYNGYGQIGDGTTTNRSTFLRVITSGVSSVACGSFHTMYVTTSGALYGVGNNAYGQLGIGNNINRSTFIVVVPSGVSSVKADLYHSAFLTSSGALYTMGYNAYGQLGDNTTTNRNSPTLVVPSGVSSIECGFYCSMYITSTYNLYATGDNYYGQLGDGTNIQSNIFKNVTPFEIVPYITVQGENLNFITDGSQGCYAIFDDIQFANFWGFVYNPVKLFGGFVKFNFSSGSKNQVTFQECGWVEGYQVYNQTYSYQDDTIYKFINSVGLYIGKQLVQEFDSKYLKFRNDTNTSYKNRPARKLLEGNTNIVDKDRIYYFDLPFIRIPFYAIPRQDIQVILKTNPFNYFSFYASLVLSYTSFSQNKPLRYTLEVPQVSYFPDSKNIDMKGPTKNLIITDSDTFTVSFNGEKFTDEKMSKTDGFYNFLNLPTQSNVIVLNNPINMSRIIDQKVNVSGNVYSESINILNISNDLAGLMFEKSDTSGYPILTGNLTNPIPDNVETYLFDQIPLSVSSIQSFYSMRVVSPIYKGPVVRIRNAYNDQEADFYTDSIQSYLKTQEGVTIEEFRGDPSNELRVSVWYDQSLNKNNIKQDMNYAQPKLIVSTNSKYVVYFFNSNLLQGFAPECWMDVQTPLTPQQFVVTLNMPDYGGGTVERPGKCLFSRQNGDFSIMGTYLYNNYANQWINWISTNNKSSFYVNGTQSYNIVSENTWMTLTSYLPSAFSYSGGGVNLIGRTAPDYYSSPASSLVGNVFELGFLENKTMYYEYDNYNANRPPVF
jgi:alpha-tubulin suppressor-like RCC1 family protein